MFKGFVDPPSPWAPLSEWIEFRDSLEMIEARTADVQEFIDWASAEIERRNGEHTFPK
ncbi:hypothetical protein [Mesorhizobium sp. M0586]|uniref:hypothetical protein n=1 Tax=unclassified Mesorhizobium TaxID=325217 RepID=UPI00333D94F0